MKTYVITGASSGIGKALAEFFSVDNIVYAGYRDKSKKNELLKISGNIQPFYIDYTKPETIYEAACCIKSAASKIDTLINAAGCVVAGAMEYIPISEIRRQFEVNVFGHIDLTKQLLITLNGGKIINISSMAGYGLFPFIAPYCASKSALDIMFNLFSLETKQNIKVVSLKLGVVATPIWSKSIEENRQTIEKCKNYSKETAYLISNAKKNELKGLSTNKVTKIVASIDKAEHPKPVYNIGFDSIITSFVSHLPQPMLNEIIKFRLKRL